MELNNASLQTEGLLIFRLEVVSPSVIPAEAGTQVADSVRHTVGKRYPDG